MVLSAGNDEVCSWHKGIQLQFLEKLEVNNIGIIYTLVPQEERGIVLLCGRMYCALVTLKQTMSVALL